MGLRRNSKTNGNKKQAQRQQPKRGSGVKRTSSQAVPGRINSASKAGFGSIHEVMIQQQDTIDDDDQSIVSCDPFCINERSASSSNNNSSTWDNLILSPEKKGGNKQAKQGSSRRNLPPRSPPQRPSLLNNNNNNNYLESNHDSDSTQSLDFFGLGGDVATPTASPQQSSANSNRPHDSFDVIEPTVTKQQKAARRVVPKGSKQSIASPKQKNRNNNDDHYYLNKRARELEEIGNIGSSEELNYDPDEGDDERAFGNSLEFSDEEDEFDYFEDAEASSYYSGSSQRNDDGGDDGNDIFDQDHSRSSSPKRITNARSSSSSTRQSLSSSSPNNRNKVKKNKSVTSERFQRVLPPNHFAAFVDHGDWRALGKEANTIRKRPAKKRINEESESDTDSDSSSSDGSYNDGDGNDHSHSQEPLDLFSDDDDDSIIAAAEKEEEENVEKKPAIRRNLSRMSSFQLRKWDGFRNQVEKLIKEAMPDNLDQVDKMMEQFAGREAELVQTLEKMTERAGRQFNKAAVHRSRQIMTTRHTQNWQTSEAVAHIAAACTIDEGVNIDTEFWKEDVSVYSNDFLMDATKGNNNNSDSESMSQIDESEESSYYSEDDASRSQSESVYTRDEDSNSYDDDDPSYR